MAVKTMKELRERIAKNKAQIADDEAELQTRENAMIARAAVTMAKTDPVFKAKLDALMGVQPAATTSAQGGGSTSATGTVSGSAKP